MTLLYHLGLTGLLMRGVKVWGTPLNPKNFRSKLPGSGSNKSAESPPRCSGASRSSTTWGKVPRHLGGAVARGVKWALSVVITSLLGGALFPVFLLMSTGKNREPLCKAYPDADFLYTIGCAVGENQWRFATFVVAGLVIGAVVGHKTYRGQ